MLRRCLPRKMFWSEEFVPITRTRHDSAESQFSYTTYTLVTINAPCYRILVRHYPDLQKRLLVDLGARLSLGECSKDDFGAALQAGEVSLGHLWAEIFSLCFYLAAKAGQSGNIQESFRFRRVNPKELVRPNRKQTVFLVRIYFPNRLIEDIQFIAKSVTEYLNAAATGRPFSILNCMLEYLEEHQSMLERQV